MSLESDAAGSHRQDTSIVAPRRLVFTWRGRSRPVDGQLLGYLLLLVLLLGLLVWPGWAHADTQAERYQRGLAIVQAVSDRLHAALARMDPRDAGVFWRVQVVNSDRVNAHCAPDGRILVTTGLIRHLNLSVDELAFSIGHEAGHLVHGDLPRRAQFIARERRYLMGLDADSRAEAVPRVKTEYIALWQQQEYSADRFGLQLAAEAGFDPRASFRLFQKNRQYNLLHGVQESADHPAEEQRAHRLQPYLAAAMARYQNRQMLMQY